MLKTLLFIIALATTASASTSKLSDILDQHQLPALTAASLKKGLIEIETVGVRKNGNPSPATNQDKWHLGSNGKAMTATLGATLVEKGFLTWDTTVSEVFTHLKVHPDFQHVTLKELFAHRAGVTTDVTRFAGGKYWKRFLDPALDSHVLRREYTEAILTSPPANDASRLYYSNSGYIVAASMMTHLTAKTWEDMMTEYVFGPLNMGGCGFGAPGAESPVQPSQPWPHADLVGVLLPVSPSENGSDNPKALGPAGIIHCPIADWFKFAQAHLDGFNGKDTAILKSSGFEFLHKDYSSQGYTSGGWIYEKRNGNVYLGHNGSNTMNFAILVLDTVNNSAYASAANRGLQAGEKGAQFALLSIGAPDVCIGPVCLLTK